MQLSNCRIRMQKPAVVFAGKRSPFGSRDGFPPQNGEFCLTNAIYRTVNYLPHSRSLPCRQHPRLSSNIGSLSCSLPRLPSSFFNRVHPLPIRIIIRPLRTASFYAIHFGGLRLCSASPKITVVGIIDRRRFATERFAFPPGKWIRKTWSVYAIVQDEAVR